MNASSLVKEHCRLTPTHWNGESAALYALTMQQRQIELTHPGTFLLSHMGSLLTISKRSGVYLFPEIHT